MLTAGKLIKETRQLFWHELENFSVLALLPQSP